MSFTFGSSAGTSHSFYPYLGTRRFVQKGDDEGRGCPSPKKWYVGSFFQYIVTYYYYRTQVPSNCDENGSLADPSPPLVCRWPFSTRRRGGKAAPTKALEGVLAQEGN